MHALTILCLMRKIDIVYEDSECAILNKPAGLAVQGGKGVKLSLDTLLAEQWQSKPYLVHRLDKDTSGLILVAKTKEAAQKYATMMQSKAVQKWYIALCVGKFQRKEGVITDALMIRGVSKPAITHFKCLEEVGSNFSLVELELGTGRMHQIRRHLALQGHPIAGDDKYGDFSLNKRLRKEQSVKKLLLHAYRLYIPREQNKPLDIKIPVPDYFSLFLESAECSS